MEMIQAPDQIQRDRLASSVVSRTVSFRAPFDSADDPPVTALILCSEGAYIEGQTPESALHTVPMTD